MKAYKYGKSFIPFPKYDEKLMKYSAPKCMQLIGFTNNKSVSRHHFMGNVECICVEPSDPHAAVALSSLIHALAGTLYSLSILIHYLRKLVYWNSS